MKIIDIIFALVCGKIVGFVIGEVLKGLGITIGFYINLVLWLVLPTAFLACLWIAFLIGKKFLFVFQAAKHLLVGAAATVIDLKVFEFILSFVFFINPLISKSISFLFSTYLKYWGNKYWTFGKHEKENARKEIIHFFVITFVGLIIDVASFYYFTKIMGPQFAVSIELWTKLSVIFAAFIAALWNFLGYKFFVFKK